MVEWRSPRNQFILALVLSSLVSIGLYFYGAWRNGSLQYGYLTWNLFLAWIPLLFAVRLMTVLRYKLWSSWEAMMLTTFWLIFLPNSFYMISDFIHLQFVKRVDVVYDAIMLTAFIFTGVILGFSSLYLINLQLKRRISAMATAVLIAMTLLICSFAMYVGRDLRWNSWDVFANPGGLLFDFSDRLFHPAAYPQMFITVFGFFILISTMYIVLQSGIRFLDSSKRIN